MIDRRNRRPEHQRDLLAAVLCTVVAVNAGAASARFIALLALIFGFEDLMHAPVTAAHFIVEE